MLVAVAQDHVDGFSNADAARLLGAARQQLNNDDALRDIKGDVEDLLQFNDIVQFNRRLTEANNELTEEHTQKVIEETREKLRAAKGAE